MIFDEMIHAHTSQRVQAAVAETLAEARRDDELIRRAAFGLARVCLAELRDRYGSPYGRRVVLLVGTGKNGADAMVAGWHLRERGVAVHAIATSGHVDPVGTRHLDAPIIDATEPGGLNHGRSVIASADMVIDGIVGDAMTGSLRAPAAFSQDEGPAWLATAGSGDVLAGIAGTLTSAGLPALEAGAMAAFVHGRAAALAADGGPLRSSQIAAHTPRAVKELLGARDQPVTPPAARSGARDRVRAVWRERGRSRRTNAPERDTTHERSSMQAYVRSPLKGPTQPGINELRRQRPLDVPGGQGHDAKNVSL